MSEYDNGLRMAAPELPPVIPAAGDPAPAPPPEAQPDPPPATRVSAPARSPTWSGLSTALTGAAGLLMHQSRSLVAQVPSTVTQLIESPPPGLGPWLRAAGVGLGAFTAFAAVTLTPARAGEQDFPPDDARPAGPLPPRAATPAILTPGGAALTDAGVIQGRSESDADMSPGEGGRPRLADAVGFDRGLPGTRRMDFLLPMTRRDPGATVASASDPGSPASPAAASTGSTPGTPPKAAATRPNPVPAGTFPWHDPDVPGIDRVSVGLYEVPSTGMLGRFEDVSGEFRTDGNDAWSWGDSRDPAQGYLLARWEAGTLHVMAYHPQPAPDPPFGPRRTAARREVDGHSLALSFVKRLESEGLHVNKVLLSPATRDHTADMYKTDPLGDGFKSGGLFKDEREIEIGFVRRGREIAENKEPVELTRGRVTAFGTHGLRTDQGVLFSPLDPDPLKKPDIFKGDITRGAHAELRYSVTRDNEMRLAPALDRSALNRPSTPNHADLAGGPAYAAGIFENVTDGALIEANNLSGHLAPYGDWAMAKTLAGAANLGLDISRAVYVEYYGVWGNAYPRRYFDMADGQWRVGKPPEGRLPPRPEPAYPW